MLFKWVVTATRADRLLEPLWAQSQTKRGNPHAGSLPWRAQTFRGSAGAFFWQNKTKML